MMQRVVISIFCEDQKGLVAAITGRLFELGANLGDTSFSILGTGSEFVTICELPDTISIRDIEQNLNRIDLLAGGKYSVVPFSLEVMHNPSAEITHVITITGGDQPGLIARLCETFIEYQTNIVRLSAKVQENNLYVLRLNVNIPKFTADSCIATVANTAESMQLSFAIENFIE